MRCLPAVFLVIIGVVGCGGNGDGDTRQPQPQPRRALVECRGTAVASGLPADFPTVRGVTFTKSVEAGPSRVVDGYFEGSLEDAYRRFRSAIRRAGYFVIFDELEALDSEVTYSGGDLGTSGIVALRKNCAQPGRISVHITNRPD